MLYDVSSSYLEGRCCALARLGYHRDGKKGKLQIVYGLLCAADGCPVAIEVFAGDVADPKTLATQVGKLKQRFDLSHVVLVGAKSPGSWGLITQARIDEDLRPAGLDWISALRAPAIKAPAIKALVDGGALQLSLFDERDLAALTAPARLAPKGDLRWSPWSAAPGERLIVGRNPDRARERTRKRAALLAATERDLTAIAAAVTRPRRPLRGAAAIGLEVGVVLDRHKMAKHFELTITDDRFSFARRTAAIAAEAALDGLYVVRTSLPAERLDDRATVRAYKSLAVVERAFRCLKTVDLQIRPIYHWRATRVRAHVRGVDRHQVVLAPDLHAVTSIEEQADVGILERVGEPAERRSRAGDVEVQALLDREIEPAQRGRDGVGIMHGVEERRGMPVGAVADNQRDPGFRRKRPGERGQEQNQQRTKPPQRRRSRRADLHPAALVRSRYDWRSSSGRLRSMSKNATAEGCRSQAILA